MRFSSILAGVSLLAAAPSYCNQGPFQKVLSAVNNKVFNTPVSETVAANRVYNLTLSNWRYILPYDLSKSKALKGADGEEEWYVYFTGKNRTCFGLCERADAAWQVSL
jgi:hypothetical protein